MAFNYFQILPNGQILKGVQTPSQTYKPCLPFYTMYHGTDVDSAIQILKHGFKQSEDGMLGRGVYISRDQDKASRYPLNDQSNQVILKLKVRVGRVKKIDFQGHPMQKTWHDHGYDTAWVPPHCGMTGSGLQEDCIWDPDRIKVIGISKAPGHVLLLLEELIEN